MQDSHEEYESDEDEGQPRSEAKLNWWDLNENFESSTLEFKEVAEICEQNPTQMVDLRPYMYERPYTVNTKDKLPKILNLFKQMHLRHLAVIHEKTGSLEGVITRQDIF
jgi:CBS domain containing-hemolysin-like protein